MTRNAQLLHNDAICDWLTGPYVSRAGRPSLWVITAEQNGQSTDDFVDQIMIGLPTVFVSNSRNTVTVTLKHYKAKLKVWPH